MTAAAVPPANLGQVHQLLRSRRLVHGFVPTETFVRDFDFVTAIVYVDSG